MIYKFARENGYKLNLLQAISYEEQYEALKNGTADIALGFFVIIEDKEISFCDVLYNGNINLFVRYSNLPESLKKATFYSSIEEFNGEKFGLQMVHFLIHYYQNIFQNQKLYQ